MIGRDNVRIMQHSEDLSEPQETRTFIHISVVRCFEHGKQAVIRLWTVFSANTPISDWKTRLRLKLASAAIRECR